MNEIYGLRFKWGSGKQIMLFSAGVFYDSAFCLVYGVACLCIPIFSYSILSSCLFTGADHPLYLKGFDRAFD